MYGCYLIYDDDKFLDLINDELDKYNTSNDSSLCVSVYFIFSFGLLVYLFSHCFCSILLFPSLSSRHRLILHRLREKDYSNLFSFSVGEEKTTRRTIICFKSQLMEEINV